MPKNQESGFVKTCMLMLYLLVGSYVFVYVVEIIPEITAKLQMQQAIDMLRAKGFEVEEVFVEYSVVNDAEAIMRRDSSYIPYLNYTSTLNDFVKNAERYGITVIYLNRALREFWFIASPERYSKDQYLVNLYCFRIEPQHLI